MIDKNVPMPDEAMFRGRGGRMSSYPFMEMEIGDSSFFEGQSSQGPAKTAAMKCQSRAGDRKFKVRVVDHGIRIWRVA